VAFYLTVAFYLAFLDLFRDVLSDILTGILSDTYSDIPYLASHPTYILTFYLANLPWILQLTSHLAFYLTFHLAFYLASFPTSFLGFYLAHIMTFYLAFYLTYNQTFYLVDMPSGILPAILSGILSVSAIYSDILQYLTFFLACVRVRARTN